MHRGDHKPVVEFQRMPRFVLGQKHLMQLLSGPDTDFPDVAVRRNGPRQVKDAHARDLWNEHLAPVHVLNRTQYEPHALFERQPKTRHAWIGHRDLSCLALLTKKGDNTASDTHDIAIPDTR